MSTYTRKNAWDANNGGVFTNQDGSFTDLYWYAKAVQTLQSRPINDATSWWFYAAIHGQYLINSAGSRPYLDWRSIAYISASANLNNLPPSGLTNLYWNQCQHGSWYFEPWHRGYLVSLENNLREVIVSELQGPEDWSLPYWNYLNQSTQYGEYNIPPAFNAQTLPDGSANPLFVPERYGPDGNGIIYVEVGRGQFDANDIGQFDTIYSDPNAPGRRGRGNIYGYYYGGEETGFSHSNGGFGDLEMNPHNFVHGMVGGTNPQGRVGLMGVPATAALDPVFYLHHCNIDRMWAAWNNAGNFNPNDPTWLDGPQANGNSRFVMPLDDQGTPWYYKPEDVTSTQVNFNGSVYDYTYDDLSLTSYITRLARRAQPNVAGRLFRLGLSNVEDAVNEKEMANKKTNELVGASDGAHTLDTGSLKTNVKLSSGWNAVPKSLVAASSDNQPDEVYLQLEEVRGSHDSNFLSLFVNDKFVNSISLFGLHEASDETGSHGGSGLTYTFNISDVVDDLHLDGELEADSLDVQIRAKTVSPNQSDITIGRISVYRSGE